MPHPSIEQVRRNLNADLRQAQEPDPPPQAAQDIGPDPPQVQPPRPEMPEGPEPGIPDMMVLDVEVETDSSSEDDDFLNGTDENDLGEVDDELFVSF